MLTWLNGTVCAFCQGHALLRGCLWKRDSQLWGTVNVLTPGPLDNESSALTTWPRELKHGQAGLRILKHADSTIPTSPHMLPVVAQARRVNVHVFGISFISNPFHGSNCKLYLIRD